MPRLRRITMPALAYLAAGAVMSLVIPTLRPFARDAPVTYSRPLDLRGDLDWLGDHMPAEIAEALQPKDVSFAWRADGRRDASQRFGEQTWSYVFWRHGADGRPDRGPEGTGNARRVRRGWPVACVEGSEWRAGFKNSISLTRAMLAFDLNGMRVDIALRPLPFGLLVDAAFWGAFMFAMRQLPPLAERFVRRRRGVCTQCAYPLRELARCPECGAIAS